MSQRSQRRQADQISRQDGVDPARVEAIQAVTHSLEYTYSGPLPPPEVLKRFEEILPGSAERIFSQFEEQSAHRRFLEAKVISAGVISQHVGSVSGLIIGLLGVGGGIWLTHEGKSSEGLTALLATLAGLVGTFLYKRNQQDSERSKKRNPEPNR